VQTGELRDLDEAVEVGRAAIRIAPDTDPADKAMFLSSFGNTLRARFERNGELRDLDEAVEVGRAAIRIAPDNHPEQARCLSNLGLALHERFERTGAVEDLEETLSVLGQAVEVEIAPPWMRVRAAHAAASLAASSDPGRAAGLMERAVLMLPEMVPRRLRRGDQQYALGSNTAGLAANATALALDDTNVDAQHRALRALRLAEAGRAVLLSQALDTRSDLTDLRNQHPDLAERFSELRELLDQDPDAALTTSGSDRAWGTGRERHRLAEELEVLLGRIRACEGFASFGLPPTPEDLIAEAAHGPVVTFNISSYRSDALLLTRHGITSCPLPRLTPDTAIAQVNNFYRAWAEATAPDGNRIAAQRTLRQTLEWLWEAAAEPALSALAALGEAIPPAQDGEPLPRVWWAPGGLLGLLPLHAAGFHTEPEHAPRRRTVLDRVISSYTPTVRALRHARRHRPQAADGARSLIVAMPTTPGHGPLPHVPEEARRIQSLLPRPMQLTGPASGSTSFAPNTDTATTAAVLARLPECTIAHFACHGASNRTDPSQSRLLLHDHATTPLTVAALAQVNLERAQLAYLSACSTANPGNDELLDEVIHLTSAFQLAGFPHVIGTLWPIDDRIAAEVAESFYTHLTTGPPESLDPNQAAAALHHTIRALRDRYPATPSVWAAYLHAGA
jgi:tetratricopeptide (TPR) repeat protein